MSNKPIINGLATYGIIRLYNAGMPVIAFLLTLLFTIGPIGMLFWLIVGWSIMKVILVPVLLVGGPFVAGMFVGSSMSSNSAGWNVCITLWFIEALALVAIYLN